VEGEEGREIAGFRIESEIGRGGMGVVYLANQHYPDRKVALKLLSPDLASDPAFRERFVHESNAAASTEHPNIVPVYGAGEADGQLYLAMRFIEGTDLASLLSLEGALSPERATRMCAEIAEALDAAHERGLIHRDVKPGNILLDARGRAYLTDFGLIRRTQLHTDITKTGQFMGTIDYCAPEQIKGGEIDGRADVYSLGCVLFECLTGSPPFRKDSEVATIYAHLEEEVPRASSKRPGTSPLLSGVASKAMAKRPEDRFATAGEMAEAIRGHTSQSAQPRRRWFAWVGVVAAVVAAGAIAVLTTVGNEGAPTNPPGGATSGETIPVGSLVQLDPEDGQIVSTTHGVAPAGRGGLPEVEAGEGALWLFVNGTLERIDPAEPSSSDLVTIGPPFTTPSLAIAERIVWAAASPEVSRVAASDLKVLRGIKLAEPPAVPDIYLTSGSGYVWAVLGDGTLTRIDPKTAKVTGTVDVGGSATAIDAGFDAVWVADDLAGTITPVDPESMELGQPTDISGGIDDIEAGAGAVWTLDTDAGVVVPIDPTTGEVGAPVRVGVRPTDLASGLDALWVANNGDGTISKVNPVTGDVSTLDVGGPVGAIAVDEHDRFIWAVVAVTRA
jgi:DNA-binding beta-propeller fold protein YncE/predicted Ser/Thr protein kinase